MGPSRPGPWKLFSTRNRIRLALLSPLVTSSPAVSGGRHETPCGGRRGQSLLRSIKLPFREQGEFIGRFVRPWSGRRGFEPASPGGCPGTLHLCYSRIAGQLTRDRHHTTRALSKLPISNYVKTGNGSEWLKSGVRAPRYPAQDLTDSLFVTQHLIGRGVSNQENETIRAYWGRTLNSSHPLDQCLHHQGGRWGKVKGVGFELLIMQLKQSGIPRALAGGEHHLECLLELVCFAVAAALLKRQVYPIPGLHEDHSARLVRISLGPSQW